MFVGVARLTFHIPAARSLKDKRRVIRSFKERLRARLPVSVAEVGDANLHQLAVCGVATVSNEAAHCQEILSKVQVMASALPDARLTNIRTELVPFGKGGAGMIGVEEPYADLLKEPADPDVEGGELPWGSDRDAADKKLHLQERPIVHQHRAKNKGGNV